MGIAAVGRDLRGPRGVAVVERDAQGVAWPVHTVVPTCESV